MEQSEQAEEGQDAGAEAAIEQEDYQEACEKV